MDEKRMTILWLRFLTEINDKTRQVPAELLADPEISKALEEVKVSAFTESELRAYDKFWDVVSSEKTLLSESYNEGLEEGKRKGLVEGLSMGEAKKALQIAKNLLSLHAPIEMIIEATGLTKEEIEKL